MEDTFDRHAPSQHYHPSPRPCHGLSSRLWLLPSILPSIPPPLPSQSSAAPIIPPRHLFQKSPTSTRTTLPSLPLPPAMGSPSSHPSQTPPLPRAIHQFPPAPPLPPMGSPSRITTQLPSSSHSMLAALMAPTSCTSTAAGGQGTAGGASVWEQGMHQWSEQGHRVDVLHALKLWCRLCAAGATKICLAAWAVPHAPAQLQVVEQANIADAGCVSRCGIAVSAPCMRGMHAPCCRPCCKTAR